MNQLTKFLLADGQIPNGNTFGQIMDQKIGDFELHHDQIQWLFPLPEASEYVSGSPILTRQDYDQLRAGYFHLDRLVSAKHYFIEFLGTYKLWMVPTDHNHRRISRAIKCISLFRDPIYADQFRQVVWKLLHDEGRSQIISDVTVNFWLTSVGYGESKEILEWKS